MRYQDLDPMFVYGAIAVLAILILVQVAGVLGVI
jgi:hypothetical protein